MAADLVAFDPDTVGTAPPSACTTCPPAPTASSPRSRGIHHVWVNGTPIVSEGAGIPAQPGKVLR